MNEIHVKIAEVKAGGEGDLLRATLGSCVGIAFVWKEKNLYGLAHCFLPETESGVELQQHGARYVNQAVLSLINLMKIKKHEIPEIEVYLAGGGNMMNNLIKSNKGQIGKQNGEAALKWLAHHGFKIRKMEMGLNCGMKILLNCTTGSVTFIRLDDIEIQMWKPN